MQRIREVDFILCEMDAKPELDVLRDYVKIVWTKGHERRCSGRWLRSNCHCNSCKSSFDRQVGSLSEDDVCVNTAEITGNSLKCALSGGDDHVIVVPLDYLFATCNCESCIKKDISRRTKNNCVDSVHSIPYVQYDKISSDEGRFSFLEMIINFGFCIVRDVPVNDKEIALDFAKSFGGIRSTLYENHWILRSDAKKINIGYTSSKLPSHSDLMMYETPPGTMFLQALRFDDDIQGGESIFVDVIKCAETLREKHPDHFHTLCRVPATFISLDMKRDIPVWLWHSKPHIQVDYFGEIVAVDWSPDMESTLRIREKDVDAYYQAHKAFKKIVWDAEKQLSFRLRAGDMAVVNNRRMTHARTAFNSLHSGDRVLMGFYTDLDDLKCEYMQMAKKLGKSVSPPKVWNRSSF